MQHNQPPQERREKMEDILKTMPTYKLVEELKKREGVDTTIVEPHTDKDMTICGPAIVLVVID